MPGLLHTTHVSCMHSMCTRHPPTHHALIHAYHAASCTPYTPSGFLHTRQPLAHHAHVLHAHHVVPIRHGYSDVLAANQGFTFDSSMRVRQAHLTLLRAHRTSSCTPCALGTLLHTMHSSTKQPPPYQAVMLFQSGTVTLVVLLCSC